MAGYGQYDIQQVDVFKPLALGEQVRQNRMMEELKNYQIAKARREEQVSSQVGQHIDAALKGDPAAEAALASLSPEWRIKIAQLKSAAETNAVMMRLHLAQAARQERLAAGGGGTGGILPPPAAMGGPTGPASPIGPIGPRPSLAPTGPAAAPTRPSPFGYSLPGQQSALPGGGDTSGADVPSPVPTEPVTPTLPPGRFQGIGAVPALDPSIPQPEGESGNEPPVSPTQAPGAGPPAGGRAPVPGGPAWVRDALTQGYAPVRDHKNKAVIEGDMMEMWTPDRKDRVFVPMKPPEKWATDPNDPKYQISVSGEKRLIPVPPAPERMQPPANHYWIDPNDHTKGVTFIPGGPADPALKKEDWQYNDKLPNTLIDVNSGKTKPIGSKPLTEQVRKDLSKLGGLASEVDALSNTFKNEPGEKGVRYGGYGRGFIGDLANVYERNIGGDKTGEADWWSRYQTQKNVVRNELFGSALTPPEQAEFEKADINPGMRPELIAKNLERQRQLTLLGVSRLANSWLADGYGKEAIEAAIGIPIAQLPKPTTARPGSRLGIPAEPPDSTRVTPGSTPAPSPANDLRKKYGLE